MLTYKNYVRAQSLEEAYELNQKKLNLVIGGNLWNKMKNREYQTAIDLCDLGLNQIVETEEQFEIGASVSLRALELHEGFNRYTRGAVREALRHIVGVQFRNVATVGGSVWGRYGFSDIMTLLRALNASVLLHGAGLLTLEEFVGIPRSRRDILVSVIVPKRANAVAYLSQRNTATDFPTLTCAAVQAGGELAVAIGATPMLATVIRDSQGMVTDCANPDQVQKFADYVAEHVRFADNMRASAEYRKAICPVLVKRALRQMADQMSGE